MEVVLSERFKRRYRKLVENDAALRKQALRVVLWLKQDCLRSSLRRHKLEGLDEWSVSVNLSIRIIYKQEANEIYLMDIGTHDDVY